MALGIAKLEKMQCSTPGCTEAHGVLVFHSACHIESPTWVTYENGALTVTCAECGGLVAEIAVAP